jgi:hypothetical protein
MGKIGDKQTVTSSMPMRKEVTFMVKLGRSGLMNGHTETETRVGKGRSIEAEQSNGDAVK